MNFAQLKAGGGQNVALNFLMGLSATSVAPHEVLFLVARGSMPHKYLLQTRIFEFYVAPRNPIFRVVYELTILSLMIIFKRIDIIYTYFGYSMIIGRAKQVCGSADSNIYFPEINFWSHYSGIKKIKLKIIDGYRAWGVRRADALIFESQAMLDRAIDLFNVKHAKYIRPSIALPDTNDVFTMPEHASASTLKLLFLCGWQLNKNVMLIPEIAAEARRKSIDMHIILTAPADNSGYHTIFSEKLRLLGVADMVSLVGPVAKSKLPSLYSQISVVALLSKLESFSNNIIESWYFKKPLLVSDDYWSRSICGDAAVYVSRDSAQEIVSALSRMTSDLNSTIKLIDSGIANLRLYPAIQDRIKEELNYVEYVHKNS